MDHLAPTDALLDLGAGAGVVEQMNFRGVANICVGLDPDPRIKANDSLDYAIMGVAERIPFRDGSFDLIVSDNVFEHLRDPGLVLDELYRVMRPGGRLFIKTPNRRHYVALLAQVTPFAFHRWVNRLRGRRTADTFPTMYRANSPDELRRLTQSRRLVVEKMELLEGRPEYMRINFFTYLFGYAYERLVNTSDRLAGWRIVIIATIRKGP